MPIYLQIEAVFIIKVGDVGAKAINLTDLKDLSRIIDQLQNKRI